MRRPLVISLVAIAALATAGIAGAWLKQTGTNPASATFTATGVERSHLRTCTGPDGSYEIAHLRLTGTSQSSDEALNGPIVFHVKSVYNTTKKLGYLEGWMRVRAGEDRRNAHGRFFAVNTNGTLDGFVHGRVNWRYAALYASVGGSFSATGGIANGTVGTGSATNAGVFFGGGHCRPVKQRPALKVIVKGDVESVDGSQLTIKPFDGSASQSCKRTDRSPDVDVSVGDDVAAECHNLDGALVLVKLRELRSR
jgi:hypothetical protein